MALTPIKGNRLHDNCRVEDVEQGGEFAYAYIEGIWWINIPGEGAIGLNNSEHPVTVEADGSISCPAPIYTVPWGGTVSWGEFTQTTPTPQNNDING